MRRGRLRREDDSHGAAGGGAGVAHPYVRAPAACGRMRVRFYNFLQRNRRQIWVFPFIYLMAFSKVERHSL